MDRQASRHCPQCQHAVFLQGVAFREISPLVSRSGKPELVTLPVPICANCGWTGTVQQMARLSPEERQALAADTGEDPEVQA
jgi:ribosomal protein S27AE